MSLQSVGKVKDTTIVTLKHPDPRATLKNPDDSAMTVTLHGPYSKRYKSTLRAQQQARVEEMASSGMDGNLSPEELDAMTRELLAKCIEDWNIWETDDIQLECTPENIEKVFEEQPWILDQLSAALGRSGNFLDAPKPN